MGSAGASSKPIQDTKFDLQAPIKTMADDQNESKSSSKKPLENPGTMEELHKKCKGRYRLIEFSGNPRLDITKYL